MAGRVTQSVVEVIYNTTDREARVTQTVIEVLYNTTDRNARVTQTIIEVLFNEEYGSPFGPKIQVI